jgi:hypothetical protein
MQEQGEAGLPDLGLVVRHTGPGYDQRLYPGHRSQPEGHIPTIKERTFTGMGEDHGDKVRSGGLPTTTVLKYSPCHHSGKVTVKEVQGTGMASPIESNQGESQVWQPSSPCPIWNVVGVIYSQMTVVTLATTI